MPKSTSKPTSSKPPRHTPLHAQLAQDSDLSKFGRVKDKKTKRRSNVGGEVGVGQGGDAEDGSGNGGNGNSVIDGKIGRRILDLARSQQDEELSQGQASGSADTWEDDEDEGPVLARGGGGPSKVRVEVGKRAARFARDDEDEEGEESEDEEGGSEVEEYEVGEEEYEELEIDPEDFHTLSHLRSSHTSLTAQNLSLLGQPGGAPNNGPGPGEGGLEKNEFDEHVPEGEPRTLADLIFTKLSAAQNRSTDPTSSTIQHATDGAGVVPGVRSVPVQPGMGELEAAGGVLDPRVGLNPKVVEVYTKVGLLLSRYKSGPLPRALKILPSLPHWAQLLALTTPPTWTPHATYACTKIFVSNLKPAEVQVFLEGILLERVRDNMLVQETSRSGKGGRLDVQLYEALKKGLYKPAAWFKGILFPLCEGGCTLKEATIIASVLTKISIPVLHSAAALLRLASMEYTGPNSLFIRVLLDKKYALPYKVVDALVFHFIRLANTGMRGVVGVKKGEEDKLPVLWHQSLLVFVQRYGADLTPDQKDALLDVIRARPHHTISSEIRREIIGSVMRGEPRPEEKDGEGDVEMR